MTNFRKLFKPDKFLGVLISAEAVSKQAQSILNEALDKATVVYSNNRKGKDFLWCKHKLTNDTHKALLIQVEPLKQCEHEAYADYDETNEHYFYVCALCKKELIPTGFKVRE